MLPTIDTARLRLRTLAEADIPALFAIFGDPEVCRYWSHPALPDLAAAAGLLAQIQAYAREGTLFQWGIALRASDEVIGTCTLASITHEHRRAELGFALARAHWGQGYVAEALPALVAHAFGALDLHRLEADIDPRNATSIRVVERLGFRREGYMRERYVVNGETQDTVFYGLLRKDREGGATGA